MPLSTFFGVETALRGILAQQMALDVTSHNIANANTAGFSRQQAVMEASPAYTVPGINSPTQPGQIGSGVDIQAYKRVRDSFLDIQYRAQSMRQGSAQSTADGLGQVQTAFNEPSDTGLQSLLSSYWASWQDVANAPENLATRQSLAQNASSLATGFNTLASQLATVQQQTGQNVTYTIGQVNSIGQQITQLNSVISQEELTGNTPNDLLDQRDQLIDQLSAMGNVSVTTNSLDSVDITFGGAALVSGSTAMSPIAESEMTSLTSGQLAGLIQMRDVTVPGYQTALDSIASTLITQTNAQHALGFDLNGNQGGTFFTGTDASTIAVNAALVASPGLIAASGDGTTGNSQNALALADMQTAAQAGLSGSTIDTAYSQLVTQVASDVKQAQQTADNATALVDAIDSRRQSVSGVSLDEEMTNLIKFQRGYQASSRALTAMDDMIDQLITRTGRVGL
jgi:flagellar hook-associated protein 1 FlgK